MRRPEVTWDSLGAMAEAPVLAPAVASLVELEVKYEGISSA